MQNLATGLNVFTQKGQPISVYINGNYWGIYNLRERVSVDLIAEYEKSSEKDITILEGGAALLKDGNEFDKYEFDLLITKIKDTDKLNELLFEEIKNSIDLNSFTDYVILESFYANGDWPNNNVLFYKNKSAKWKWVLQDLDYGLAYTGPNAVNLNLFDKLKSGSGVVSILFNALVEFEEYNNDFKIRCYQIVEKNFSDSNIDLVWNKFIRIYEPEIQKQIDRWRVLGTKEDWKKNCEKNKEFLKNRKAVYLKQINNL